MITPSWLSRLWRSFLYSSSVYSCHLFLMIYYASVRPIAFLSFIVPIFAWNVPLVSLIFLRSLVFPILLFSICIDHWGRLSYLSLYSLEICIQMGITFPFSPLPLASLLFSAICKASSDNHFAFLHFFFLGMVLVTTSFTMLQTCVHSSPGTLSTRSHHLNQFITSIV